MHPAKSGPLRLEQKAKCMALPEPAMSSKQCIERAFGLLARRVQSLQRGAQHTTVMSACVCHCPNRQLKLTLFIQEKRLRCLVGFSSAIFFRLRIGD